MFPGVKANVLSKVAILGPLWRLQANVSQSEFRFQMLSAPIFRAFLVLPLLNRRWRLILWLDPHVGYSLLTIPEFDLCITTRAQRKWPQKLNSCTLFHILHNLTTFTTIFFSNFFRFFNIFTISSLFWKSPIERPLRKRNLPMDICPKTFAQKYFAH